MYICVSVYVYVQALIKLVIDQDYSFVNAVIAELILLK